eukprot:9510950-Karenia_brevis.AAC.1
MATCAAILTQAAWLTWSGPPRKRCRPWGQGTSDQAAQSLGASLAAPVHVLMRNQVGVTDNVHRLSV